MDVKEGLKVLLANLQEKADAVQDVSIEAATVLTYVCDTLGDTLKELEAVERNLQIMDQGFVPQEGYHAAHEATVKYQNVIVWDDHEVEEVQSQEHARRVINLNSANARRARRRVYYGPLEYVDV